MPATASVRIRHGDKLLHFAAYFFLAYLGGRYLLSAGRGASVATFVAWAGVYALYGALDEILQPVVERTMSLGDWLFDLAGVAAATLWLVLRRQRTGLSEPGGRTPQERL